MAQKEGVRQRWMENKMESEKKRAAELNEKKTKTQDGVMILLPSWPKASMIDIIFISSFLV